MEMYLRVLGLFPGLLWNRLRYGRALDILISHSPPFGINDDDSSAHRGLLALNFLIRWAKPRYHLHGHMHVYNRNLEVSTTTVGSTQVVNVFPYQVIEVPDE
jgi:Icc-related predicted phosphoesterase